MDTKVKSIIKDIIKDGMTDLEKANAIYNYILDNVEYESRGWQINNANHAYGALVVGRAQCSGYSRALTLLCAQVGIETRYVVSIAKGSGHKWSMIKIDGQFYHIDMQATDDPHDDPLKFIDLDGDGIKDDSEPEINMDMVHDITWQLMGDSNMDGVDGPYKWDRKHKK